MLWPLAWVSSTPDHRLEQVVRRRVGQRQGAHDLGEGGRSARGEQIEPITYWATVGQKIILNGTQHKVAQLGYGFKGQLADGLIIRVSTTGADLPTEYELQRQFLESLMHALRPDVRSRVMGELSTSLK